MNKIKNIALAAVAGLGLSSCDDFLDRPAEDNYNVSNYYQTDAQCIAGVNSLYNSPWYDFQRGFFKVGEVLAGNYYWGSSPYLTFTVNSTDTDLVNMSYSLWSVNAYCNTIMDNINASNGPSQTVKNTCIGECLTWKAMSYFYLVRTFGAVPIVHNNTESIAAGDYNSVYKAQISDVYAYIIKTLETAIELLPADNTDGRIDQYVAKALLAKVYLTKSGFDESKVEYNGSYVKTSAHERNEEDLAQAALYAKDVIDNSGRNLLENYEDIFRLENNTNEESLLAWHWSASADIWTCQNTLQSDLAISGFDEFGDCWGGYAGPSVDLQDAFDESALRLTRNNTDVRRHATMMMAGDTYDYFYTDCGGFDYLGFIYGGYTDHVGPGEYQSPTGANEVKHLYGDAADHIAGCGVSASNMRSQLSTHILRLADIYLIYAEAVIGNNGSTTNSDAIDAFYAVRSRSIAAATRPSSITWEDVWKERRLELACEGDRWYDYVRWFYYAPDSAIAELKAQRRDVYYGLNDYYKAFNTSGSATLDETTTRYNEKPTIPNVIQNSFTLPFPSEDVVMNPNLLEKPIHVDVSQYNY